MVEPTVSILIVTYNRAGFLNRAIGSALTQTYPDWELLVVDDGSTDEA
jgi:glycosyltransferase involved in cell wall biosynthesis